MECVRIIDTNSANIHQFSLCGYKNNKNEGFRKKIEWIKQRYPEGLKYKVLYSDKDGSIGGIEYIPGDYAWRPVKASGYMFIHCIFILPNEYKRKGFGSLLVEECIKDAEINNMNGVAVVTRKGTWMVGREVFIKKGFEVADIAKPDFELLVKKFDKEAYTPKFINSFDEKLEQYSEGLYMLVSHQCPYTDKVVKEIGDSAKKDYSIDIFYIEIKGPEDVRLSPCAFGTFCMIYNGELIADHPISKTRFKNIMNKLI